MKRSIGLLLVLAAAACGSDDPSQATLRVVHASPDAPAVDVYARGVATPLFSNVSYGQATNSLTVDAGEYTIDLRAAGAAATSDPVFSVGPIDLTAEGKFTALATGLLASTDAADRFRVLALADGFTAPAAGKARIRVVHAAPDAPTVGIDLGDDGSAEVASLARFADTGDAGIEVPSATALQVGIRAGNARVTAFTVPALDAGATYYVIASGLLGKLPREADGFSLLAVSGAAARIKQNPVVYALHGSPDTPAVDLFAGSAELVDNVSFGQLSAPIQVPPGSYTIDFFVHAAGSTRPAGDPARSAATPALAAGERYLAVANGFLTPAGGEPAFELLAFADAFATTSAPKVRVLHASPDAPEVDVGTSAGGVLSPIDAFKSLTFKEASSDAGTDVPVGALTIGVAAAGSTTTLKQYTVTTANGVRAFALALGAFSVRAGVDQPFGLFVIDTAVNPWTVAKATESPL